MEQDKRIRREIANSNERRRMESINSGFQALRQLLPHQQGEKLSKAAILQQTADNIYALEQEKTQLLSQNCQLKRLLGQQQMEEDDETDSAPKRRLIDTGQRLLLEDDTEELNDVQIKLERERKMRIALEERVRGLEEQLYQTQPRQSDLQKYTPTEECVGINMEQTTLEQPSRQTVLTKAAQKQGLDLPSIIQYAIGKSDGSRVEVEEIPRLADMTMDSQTHVDAISVQDPNTGNTRQYVITQVDNTSRQNLETIVEAIRHLEGDHLFSDESGPHEVVKEEIVESSMLMDEGGTFVEMTLPNGTIQGGTILTTLPKSGTQSGLVQLVQSLPQSTMSVSLPTVPVSLQQVANMSNLHPNYLTNMQQQLPQSVSSLVSSIQLPPVSLPQAPVAELQYETVSLQQAPTPMHIQANSPLPTIANSPLPSMSQMEMGSQMSQMVEASRVEYPPQTSPVNLELQSSDSRGELSNSPPQSSPVNLAHPSIEQ